MAIIPLFLFFFIFSSPSCTRQLIYQSFSLGGCSENKKVRTSCVIVELQPQRLSLCGCVGQQSDNGWRGLLEPDVPLDIVNAVRGGWRGSSAFISTFRDAHSRRSLHSAHLPPYCVALGLPLSRTVRLNVFYASLALRLYLTLPNETWDDSASIAVVFLHHWSLHNRQVHVVSELLRRGELHFCNQEFLEEWFFSKLTSFKKCNTYMSV